MVYTFYGCRDHHGATPKDRLDETGQAYQELAALLDKYRLQHTNVSIHIFTGAMYMAQIFLAVFPCSDWHCLHPLHGNGVLKGQAYDSSWLCLAYT